MANNLTTPGSWTQIKLDLTILKKKKSDLDFKKSSFYPGP